MNIHSADTDISQAISQTQTLQPPKLSLKLSLFPLEAANTYMAIERWKFHLYISIPYHFLRFD